MDYENGKNPFRERREQISKWKMYAVEDIIENEDMLGVAETIRKKGIKTIDSLRMCHTC